MATTTAKSTGRTCDHPAGRPRHTGHPARLLEDGQAGRHGPARPVQGDQPGPRPTSSATPLEAPAGIPSRPRSSRSPPVSPATGRRPSRIGGAKRYTTDDGRRVAAGSILFLSEFGSPETKQRERFRNAGAAPLGRSRRPAGPATLARVRAVATEAGGCSHASSACSPTSCAAGSTALRRSPTTGGSRNGTHRPSAPSSSACSPTCPTSARAWAKAGSDFQKFSRSVETASRVATGVIGAIGGIGVSAIQAASDLGETSSAVEQVFGRRAAAQLQTFAASAAQSLGQSRQQALSAAQTFGIFGHVRRTRRHRPRRLHHRTRHPGLRPRLVQQHRRRHRDHRPRRSAARRVRAHPPVRRAPRRRHAQEPAPSPKASSRPTERGARPRSSAPSPPTPKSSRRPSLQQGDFARTSDGLANSQRVLQAELENFRVELGEELLPVVQELLPVLRGFVDNITAVATREARPHRRGHPQGRRRRRRPQRRPQGVRRRPGRLAACIVGQPASSPASQAQAAATVVTGAEPAARASSEAALPSPATSALRRPTPSASGSLEQTRQAPAGQRQTGNVQVNVTGVVGSTYQVQREIERQLEAARRNRLTAPGRPRNGLDAERHRHHRRYRPHRRHGRLGVHPAGPSGLLGARQPRLLLRRPRRPCHAARGRRGRHRRRRPQRRRRRSACSPGVCSPSRRSSSRRSARS